MELNEEPGGEGKWTGGKGIRLDYRIRSDGCFLTAGYTRSKILPWALEGGNEGTPNYVRVLKTDGSSERYSFVSGLTVNKDDVIRIVTGTGGGLGSPADRDRDAVKSDIRNGYITKERAEKVYGPID